MGGAGESVRFLILSCNTGEGHNACARAIREELERRGIACDVADGLRFVSPAASRFISDWHVRLYRWLPQVYARAYDYADRHAAMMNQDALICRFLGLGCKRLRAYILAGGYDGVLCTHLFPAIMLSRMQRKDPLPIRTGFIATDYTASPGCGAISTDYCFIPDERLAGNFAAAGISRSRIVASGIPVRAAFRETGEGDPLPRILLMGGSMGCGPIRRLVGELVRRLPRAQIGVVCGSNRRLERQLNRGFGALSGVRIHGRVDNVPELMDGAALYLTKPGGISVTEACAKALPLVLIPVVGGCEGYNLRFYVDAGAARTARKPRELAEICAGLIGDKAARGAMSEAMKAMRHQNAAQVICDIMTGAVTR